MTLEKASPGKINLFLNVLDRRPDGFHEIETVIQPVPIYDHLTFSKTSSGISLQCDRPELPVDDTNLVVRAAKAFFEKARISAGVRVELKKNIPMAAGLGGGSSNAAKTLQALNELFDGPLSHLQLQETASSLGSDVPCFLYDQPVLATGRGEMIVPLPSFPVLNRLSLLLVHPGFGVATAWAYQQFSKLPSSHKKSGAARDFIDHLQKQNSKAAMAGFYNSLETPVFMKYPILALYKEFFLAGGALTSMMSGSGSSVFALFPDRTTAERGLESFYRRFGSEGWGRITALGPHGSEV